MEEAEKYGDMVFLNTPEAMNEGKTYEWLVKAWELYGSCPKLKYIAKGVFMCGCGLWEEAGGGVVCCLFAAMY